MATPTTFDVRLQSDKADVTGVFVRRLTGREAMSELYRFEVDVVCESTDGLPDALGLGATLTLVLARDGVDVRRVHGFVIAIDATLESTGSYEGYRLVIVPRLHRMKLVHSASVYASVTFDEVLTAELREFEFIAPGSTSPHDYELQLLDKTPKRPLVIQFGETDFDFISRLAEHYGVSYFIEQTDDHDRVVFTDHNARFRPCAGAESVPWNGEGTSQSVYALKEASRIVPGFYNVTGYNYRTPKLAILGEHELAAGHTAGGFVELDSSPGTPEDAAALAKIRAEEQGCRQVRYFGKSTLPNFAPGTRTTITDHPRLGPSGSKELLLVEVIHEAELPLPWEEAKESTYRNEFVAVPVDRRFRPERKTPKPKMPGVVSAIVQPAHNEDENVVAKLDELGRYHVHFNFDLEHDDRGETSSRLRMVQPFEGGNYGMHFPIRPGTEVIVAFVNGDPDEPIILGAAPTARTPSPVTSVNAQMHRIKSPGGTVVEFGRPRGTSTD